MAAKPSTHWVHEGRYAAEVNVESIPDDDVWGPYLSLEDIETFAGFAVLALATLDFALETVVVFEASSLGAEQTCSGPMHSCFQLGWAALAAGTPINANGTIPSKAFVKIRIEQTP